MEDTIITDDDKEESDIPCGSNAIMCGGCSELGSKCYTCPAYSQELDGRLD